MADRKKLPRLQRVEESCRNVVPAKALAGDAPRALKDKKGVEKKYGEFLAKVLADPVAGTRLCHAMLLPLPKARRRSWPSTRSVACSRCQGARLERRGKASVVTITNPRYLNAEDDTTLEGLETAVDVALLDTKTEVCVLRGGVGGASEVRGAAAVRRRDQSHPPVPGEDSLSLVHPARSRAGQQVLPRPRRSPTSSPEVDSIEKLWIAAVEGFAIGGHCQILLDDGLRPRGAGRVHDAARTQGGHHPRRRQSAAAALRRRSHRAPGDHGRAAPRLRRAPRDG